MNEIDCEDESGAVHGDDLLGFHIGCREHRGFLDRLKSDDQARLNVLMICKM